MRRCMQQQQQQHVGIGGVADVYRRGIDGVSVILGVFSMPSRGKEVFMEFRGLWGVEQVLGSWDVRDVR